MPSISYLQSRKINFLKSEMLFWGIKMTISRSEKSSSEKGKIKRRFGLVKTAFYLDRTPFHFAETAFCFHDFKRAYQYALLLLPS